MKNGHASPAGAMMRECIRAAMHIRGVRDGGLITLGASHAKAASRWKTPKGYRLSRYDESGLPMELLELCAGRNDCAILQLHGGAYMIGFMDMYRRLALRYSRLADGAPVLSIDYRIAPDYCYPAALEDALKAWNWLIRRGVPEHRIIVAGDSAGGNLALALTLKLRDTGRPVPGALILMSPWADMAGVGESRTFNYGRDPMFGKNAGSKGLPGNPYAGDTDLRDPYLSPIFAEYHGFPPMLIQVGTWEMLLSDARTVAGKARAAGVPVDLSESPGMFHVFQGFRDLLPESRQAWREVGDYLKKHI